MTYLPAKYVATAGQRDFTVPFPFINRSHVEVLVNGIQVNVLEWLDGTTLRLASPLAAGSSVVIRRVTPIDEALVEFQNGAILTQEDLNTAVQQLLYKQQEIVALYNGALSDAQVRLAQNLGIVTAPEAVADLLAIEVLGSDLLDQFRQRIADIDLNAENIIQQALEINQLSVRVEDEATGRALSEAQLLSSVNTINTTITELEGSVVSLSALVDSLATIDGEGIATVIANEEQSRIEGDTALANTLSLLGAKNGDNTAFVLNANTVRVNSTESLAQRLAAITAKADGNEARIMSEETARANGDSALASSLTALTARVGTAEANIVSQETARIAGDNALAQTLSLIGAKNPSGNAFILNTGTVRVSASETLSQRLEAIQAQYNNTVGLITSEQTVRANADSALSANLSSLSAQVQSNAAAITAEQVARADGDNAVAASVTTLSARVGTAEASIRDEAAARASADSAFVATIDALTLKVDGNTAAITSANQARIDGDNALASSISALVSRVDANAAAIVTEQTARANADSSLAQQINSLGAVANSNSAAIQNEATTRANADSAFAQQFALLGAKNGDGSAWVLDQNTVQVSPGVSLGTRLSGIDASLGSNAAAIVTEQTARANADSSLAQQITTLSSTVNGNSASITSVQQVINGLNAKYGVSLNVNGHITGFVQNNNGTTGTFTVVADYFSIVAPNGGNPVTPFSVTAEGVRINGNLIVNGSIYGSMFDLTTMVRRGSLTWSGSNTPPLWQKTVLSHTDLGPVGRDGSYRIDYDVRFNALVGQQYGTYDGLPYTTTYLANGYVGVEVIGDNGAVLAQQLFSAHEYQNSGLSNYAVVKQGQVVVDRVGVPQSNARLQLVAYNHGYDTGPINDGDYYYRNTSATYTASYGALTCKWTIL